MVITERQFIQVQRQIFLADMVELPVHGAFHNRPKALNGVGVNVPVLAGKQVTAGIAFPVGNRAVQNMVVHPVIAGIFIRVQNAVRHIQHRAHDFYHIGGSHFLFLNRPCFNTASHAQLRQPQGLSLFPGLLGYLYRPGLCSWIYEACRLCRFRPFQQSPPATCYRQP